MGAKAYFIIAIAIIILLSFQLYLFYKTHKRFKTRKWWRYGKIAYLSSILLSQLIIYALVFFGRKANVIVYEGAWAPFYYWFLSWNYSFIFFLPIWIFMSVSILLFERVQKAIGILMNKVGKKQPANTPLENKSLGHEHKEDKKETKENKENKEISRRNFLAGTLGSSLKTAVDLAPVAAFTFSYSRMLLASNGFDTMERNVSIANLPRDLQGFRIMQISDMHIGNLIHENYLQMAYDRIMQSKADILVVTGDIIDNNNYFIPQIGKFFYRLESHFPLGIYGVLGNHDFLDNADELEKKLKGSDITILRNQNKMVRRGNAKLNLVGLDYPMRLGGMGKQRLLMSQKYFRKVQPHIRQEAPTIVLNHHPSDFEYLKNEKVDLVLSGHTHGGQIILSKNRESPLALASNFFQYYVDLYTENNSSLYVNRGFGHWFPVRIGCPPEITVLTLV